MPLNEKGNSLTCSRVKAIQYVKRALSPSFFFTFSHVLLRKYMVIVEKSLYLDFLTIIFILRYLEVPTKITRAQKLCLIKIPGCIYFSLLLSCQTNLVVKFKVECEKDFSSFWQTPCINTLLKIFYEHLTVL